MAEIQSSIPDMLPIFSQQVKLEKDNILNLVKDVGFFFIKNHLHLFENYFFVWIKNKI